MERAMSLFGGMELVAIAIVYAFFALVIITLDRFRATSTSKEDNQVELKILIFALALMSVFLAAGGVTGLLATILGGFKGGGDAIKAVLAPILVGVGAFFALVLGLLPRTNSTTARGPETLALLLAGVYFGCSAISGAYAVIEELATSGAWATTSAALARLIVDGALGIIALVRLGAIAGWAAPVRPMPPPGYPPQGGGYPPQGGGYPPQGGGYPPQGGGGYPPR